MLRFRPMFLSPVCPHTLPLCPQHPYKTLLQSMPLSLSCPWEANWIRSCWSTSGPWQFRQLPEDTRAISPPRMNRKLRQNSWVYWRYSMIHWIKPKFFDKNETTISESFDRKIWTCKHYLQWSALQAAIFSSSKQSSTRARPLRGAVPLFFTKLEKQFPNYIMFSVRWKPKSCLLPFLKLTASPWKYAEPQKEWILSYCHLFFWGALAVRFTECRATFQRLVKVDSEG